VRGGGELRARCGEAETGAPFIGSRWRVEAAGREDGGGRCVLLTHWLLEEEATGQRRFKGEMKRSRRRVSSTARRLVRAPDVVAAVGISIGSGTLAVGGGR
jgi:hypothetical protein